MRWRLCLLAVAAGTAFLSTASQPGTAQQTMGVGCPDSAGSFARASARVYSFKHWRRGAKPAAVERLKAMSQCVPGSGRVMAKDRWLLHRHRDYRMATPFRGYPDEGYWLKWLAIPRWVVGAETRQCDGESTGLARGRCRWVIRNPDSGACTVYQFIGHTSCRSTTWRDKLRLHRAAHQVLRDEGPGAWTPWG